MKIELKAQNLIDKHSKRLLSSLRLICNSFNCDNDDAEITYDSSSSFLYYLIFVLYAEEFKIARKPALTDFLVSALDKNFNSSRSSSENFTDLLKEQCYDICQNPIFEHVSMDLDRFNFSVDDIISIAEYTLLDDKGARVSFVALKLEFLNYFYELLLKYFIVKADQDLIVIHKGTQETYKEDTVTDHTQLKLSFDKQDEVVYAGQWIIKKGCKRNQCQGAFYTPPKIVDYITDKSLVQLKSLKDVRIIDPACGCGAFLLNIYYYLLDRGFKPKDIIEKHLYGIDIDSTSVEISRLVLTLASGYYSKNIVCHDSLDKENPPFKDNYFDAVIGNPPYLNIERIDKDKKKYYLKAYKSAIRRFDLYIVFIEHAIDTLLKKDGVLGYIIPDKLLTQSYAKGIREILLDQCCISEIVELKYNGLFKGASVTPIILICKKPMILDNFIKIIQMKPEKTSTNELNQEDYRKTFNFIFRLSLDNNKKEILDLVQEKSKPVAKACYVSWGLQPGNTKKFIYNASDRQKNEMYKNHPSLKDIIRGGNIDRYSITYTDDKVLYIIEGPDKLHRPAFPELFETDKIVVPEVSGSKGLIASLDTNHYYTNHSAINVIMKRDLLRVDKKVLKARGVKLELTKSNQEPDLWQIDKGAYTRTTMVYRTDRDSLLNIRYILALMNSKLIRFYFNNFLTGELNVFPELVKRLPYYHIELDEDNHNLDGLDEIAINEDFDDMTDEDIHNQLVRLTYEIYNSRPHERPPYIQLIDKAVYKLYGLEEKHISLVEADLN